MSERRGEIWPTHCARCHERLNICTMSVFNTDTICMACKQDEQQAPGYKAAVDAECEACRHGNYNHPGVGLSPEAYAFLEHKRAARGKAQVAN